VIDELTGHGRPARIVGHRIGAGHVGKSALM
jgi:hypothetical protein